MAITETYTADVTPFLKQIEKAGQGIEKLISQGDQMSAAIKSGFSKVAAEGSATRASFTAMGEGVKKVTTATQVGMERAARSVETLDKSVRKMGTGAFRGMVQGIAAAGIAFDQLKEKMMQAEGALLQPAASIETLREQYSVLGGQDGLDFFEKIKKYADTTPFGVDGILAGGRSLYTVVGAGDEAYATLKRLGDMAAAAKVPIEELSLSYSRVVTNGLKAEELNMFGDKGIDIRGFLAQRDGISTQEVAKRAEQGRYGKYDMDEALAVMTAEGGKFAGGVERLAGTYEGLKSTLLDTFKVSMQTLGEQFLPEAKAKIKELTEYLMTNQEKFREAGEMMSRVFDIEWSEVVSNAKTLVMLLAGAKLVGALSTMYSMMRLTALQVKGMVKDWRRIMTLKGAASAGKVGAYLGAAYMVGDMGYTVYQGLSGSAEAEAQATQQRERAAAEATAASVSAGASAGLSTSADQLHAATQARVAAQMRNKEAELAKLAQQQAKEQKEQMIAMRASRDQRLELGYINSEVQRAGGYEAAARGGLMAHSGDQLRKSYGINVAPLEGDLSGWADELRNMRDAQAMLGKDVSKFDNWISFYDNVAKEIEAIESKRRAAKKAMRDDDIAYEAEMSGAAGAEGLAAAVQRERELVASGLTPSQARQRAALEYGRGVARAGAAEVRPDVVLRESGSEYGSGGVIRRLTQSNQDVNKQLLDVNKKAAAATAEMLTLMQQYYPQLGVTRLG